MRRTLVNTYLIVTIYQFSHGRKLINICLHLQMRVKTTNGTGKL